MALYPFISLELLHVVSWSPNRMWEQSCLHSLGHCPPCSLCWHLHWWRKCSSRCMNDWEAALGIVDHHISHRLCWQFISHKICWWSNTNYFIKSQSSLHIFPIFWEMSIGHFHHIQNLIVCRVGCVSSELATFLMDHWFYLKEWLTDKLLLFWVWYLVGIFSKMLEVNLSFQQKQLAVFVANDGIWAFKWKWEFGNFVHTLESLTVSQ